MSRLLRLPVTVRIMRGTSPWGQARARKPAARFIFQYVGVGSAYSRGCEGKTVSADVSMAVLAETSEQSSQVYPDASPPAPVS